jgi:regulation of enolase protein 1 (concanavalin A-like superfamily)
MTETAPAFPPLHESFNRPGLDPRLRWLREPRRWSLEPAEPALVLSPDAATDFWQRTHYGFRVDNGHFLHAEVAGDFVLTTRVRFLPVHQYDQAGLMVRFSADCWLKTSVEFEPHGPNRLGSVVTNHGYSDWATQDLSREVSEVSFRIRREGADCLVETSLDGTSWSQIRMAHLVEDGPGAVASAGLYACSPKGAGYVARFHFLRLEPGRHAPPPGGGTLPRP